MRPLVGAFFLASLASTLVAGSFIFAVRVVFSTVVTASLAAALLTSRRGTAG